MPSPFPWNCFLSYNSNVSCYLYVYLKQVEMCDAYIVFILCKYYFNCLNWWFLLLSVCFLIFFIKMKIGRCLCGVTIICPLYSCWIVRKPGFRMQNKYTLDGLSKTIGFMVNDSTGCLQLFSSCLGSVYMLTQSEMCTCAVNWGYAKPFHMDRMQVLPPSRGRTGEDLEMTRIHRENACEISATMIAMYLWPQEEITLVTAAARKKKK